MSLTPVRRVVAGHDAHGAAAIASDGALRRSSNWWRFPAPSFMRSGAQRAAPVGNGDDPSIGALRLPPPALGTRIRFVDIPPDTEEFLRHGATKMPEAFGQIGDVEASTVKPGSPHPLMHRTQSVDYGVVMSGEMTLVLDKCETLLKAGDVVVQRGTNHAWANRSGKPCRMLFVLGMAGTNPKSRAREHEIRKL